MGHDVQERKPVILKKIVFMAFQSQLLPEGIHEIDVDFNNAVDRQITEERAVHEALNRLVGRRGVLEVTDQDIPVAPLQGLAQLLVVFLREIAQKQGGVALVEDAQIPQATLEPIGEPPRLWGRGGLTPGLLPSG